jgi:aminobenzoyl-glutamate utilization protein B
MDPAPRLIAAIDAKGPHYAEMAKQIWTFAEVAVTRKLKSSALLATELETAGFKVTRGVVGIPTAFVAEFGTESPSSASSASSMHCPASRRKFSPLS